MRNTAVSGRKQFLLAMAGVTLAVLLVVVALMASRLSAQSPDQAPVGRSPDRPTFDVASVKPNKSGDTRRSISLSQPGGRVTATARLRDLITAAYQLSGYQRLSLFALTDPIYGENFDIEARAEGNPGIEEKYLMLQSLLAERFKLVVHWETRHLPVYALVVSKPGELGRQIHPHTDDSKCIDRLTQRPSPPIPDCGVLAGLLNGQTAYRVTMDQLAMQLGYFLSDRPVVNQTGLQGTFDLSLSLTLVGTKADQAAGLVDTSGATSIFTALQEQLGLKLQGQAGTVDVLVIDHVEEPSEN